MVEKRIEELENQGFVIKSLKIEGKEVDIEMVEDVEMATSICVVDIDQYEANGYTTDGLVGIWLS